MADGDRDEGGAVALGRRRERAEERERLEVDPRKLDAGEATRLVSIFGYDTAFKFQQTGYAAALFVTIGIIILAFALFAVRMLKRAGPE